MVFSTSKSRNFSFFQKTIYKIIIKGKIDIDSRGTIMAKRCTKCGFILKDDAVQCPLCHQYAIVQTPVVPTTRISRITNNNDVILYVDDGSFLGGFLLYFFLNFIGLIIALAINKKKTTLGAVVAFIVFAVLTLASIVAMIVFYLKFPSIFNTIKDFVYKILAKIGIKK